MFTSNFAYSYYPSISTVGWYRIAQMLCGEDRLVYGLNGIVNLSSVFENEENCSKTILINGTYESVTFTKIGSNGSLAIDGIRFVKKDGYFYIDIYYARITSNSIYANVIGRTRYASFNMKNNIELVEDTNYDQIFGSLNI